MSGLIQNNSFLEHSRKHQKTNKLGILCGAKALGSFGLNSLQSNPLKPFSQPYGHLRCISLYHCMYHDMVCCDTLR